MKQELRLRRIFGRAMWLALAAPIALPIACAKESESEPTKSVSGARDAGVDGDPSLLTGECKVASFVADPPDTCDEFVRLPCGVPPDFNSASGCYFLLKDCSRICSGTFLDCHTWGSACDGGVIAPDDAGGVEIECTLCAGVGGRVPAGLERASRRRASSVLGDYFVNAAHLEAASVDAFGRLHDELAAHRAPRRLLGAARRARSDEVRHARVVAKLARRFGGAPVRPRVGRVALRELEVVAIENAIEGCIRETFSALLARFQAAHAADARIARAMKGIARDEARHAALSWEVATWAHGRLDDDARLRLAKAAREAVKVLRREIETPLHEDLVAIAGLPNAAQRRALLAALDAELWVTLR